MSGVDQIFQQWNRKAKYEIAKSGVAWQKVSRIPFSSPRLQYLTYGGIGSNSLAEFSGPEGAGKTCAALDLVGNVQRLTPERDVVFFDVEGTFDSRWAAKLGVNIQKLKYVLPLEETAEQIFQMIIELLQADTTDISLIVVDSIATMISQQAYEKDMEQNTMGGIAKPLTLFCNKVCPLLRKKNCALILINQVRDDMNSMYGGTVTPGGRGLKHACSLRLEFRRSDFFDASGNVVSTAAENPSGHYVKVLLKKTKICRPDRKVGFFTLNYLDGIDYISDMIDVGLKLEVFSRAGAFYSAADENGELQKFQGKSKFYSWLQENKEVRDIYVDRINKLLCAEDDEEEALYYKQLLEDGVNED